MPDFVYVCVTLQSLMLMVLAIGLYLAIKRLESVIDRVLSTVMKKDCSSVPMSSSTSQRCESNKEEKSGACM